MEARIRENQFTYSLLQLRLVGVVLMLIVMARLLVFLLLGLHLGPLEQLSTLGALSNWLPLLPLAVALYLLGAGRQRLWHEKGVLIVLHHGLIPLALICVLALPSAILQNLFHGLRLTAGVDLTFYQRELLSPMRTVTSLALCAVAGVGLLLLKRQGDSEMKRHRLDAGQFFQLWFPRQRSRHHRPTPGDA
jgi:hypothetical protein